MDMAEDGIVVDMVTPAIVDILTIAVGDPITGGLITNALSKIA